MSWINIYKEEQPGQRELLDIIQTPEQFERLQQKWPDLIFEADSLTEYTARPKSNFGGGNNGPYHVNNDIYSEIGMQHLHGQFKPSQVRALSNISNHAWR